MGVTSKLKALAKELIEEGTKNIEVYGEHPDTTEGFDLQAGVAITNRQAITIGKFIQNTQSFPTQRDLNRLRDALHAMGYSVPVSNEELGNNYAKFYRQLTTAVIYERKKNGRESNSKRS